MYCNITLIMPFLENSLDFALYTSKTNENIFDMVYIYLEKDLLFAGHLKTRHKNISEHFLISNR